MGGPVSCGPSGFPSLTLQFFHSLSVSVFLYPLVATNDMDLYGSLDSVRDCEGLTLVRHRPPENEKNETNKTVPWIVADGNLLDLVQWPIKSTTAVHVLSPRPDLLNL